MKIVDPNGIWVLNKKDFKFFDSASGTMFESGELTKATETGWVREQVAAGLLSIEADPFNIPADPVTTKPTVPQAPAVPVKEPATPAAVKEAEKEAAKDAPKVV